MKVVVLYRPNSEQARPVEDFLHEFERRYPDAKLEVINVDSREGIAIASLYDIVQYPAVMVLQTDGYAQNIWQGQQLPLMDEIAGYAYAGV